MRKKHYFQFWGGKTISKTYVKKVINFDFKRLIEKVEGGHRMLGGSKKLLSPSAILKPFRDAKFFGTPSHILEQRRQDGSVLMEYLEKIFIEKQTNINDFPITTKQKKDLHNLFTFFINNNIKILAVEKPITNGIVYGIIDCVVVKDSNLYVMEIKLRNSLKIENTDRFQAKVYSYLMEIPALILCLADNGDTHMEELKKADFAKEMEQVENMYKLFGLDLSFKQQIKI